MTETISLKQNEFLASKPQQVRKELGQFFTVADVADYMASFINPIFADEIRILDAGAGAGILTVSAAKRCLEFGANQVNAVLYEIDLETISILQKNMDDLTELFRLKGATFTYEIRNEDFVLARPDISGELFHISSINPPYFKYNSKSSQYAGATADLFKGNPNIYASFMAIVSNCLTLDGQMVAIVPRSYTNGLYFKGFRKFLNNTMNLNKIHIFRSRGKVFGEQSVLQENIICHYVKAEQGQSIDVCASSSYQDLGEAQIITHRSDKIIDKSNDHEIIRIPESEEETRILELVEEWESSFKENGYFISTGRVVEHRTREYILSPVDQDNSIPLLRMHNIKRLNVEWTGNHKKDARFSLTKDYLKHITSNKPYVLLKRFSSKDEKKRLVSGVYDPNLFDGDSIALENHLNFVGRENEDLELTEARGLSLLLNSTLMDKYFRCISGNTQVNATEIRLLKLPPRLMIRQMGELVAQTHPSDQVQIDNIVDFCLNS